MDLRGWLPAFIATLVIEVPVYTLALRNAFGLRRSLYIGLAVNVLTHPLAWSAMMAIPFPTGFVTTELLVWAVEATLVFTLGRRRWSTRPLGWIEAGVISLVANGLSAGLGLML